MPSELEVDEGLKVGSDELADDEDGDGAGQNHQRKRHRCEPDAVATLEVLRKPMDYHSDDEDQNHSEMLLYHLRYKGKVPLTAYTLDHILCRAPRLLIRLRRVQIGAASEEKAGEGYEYERHSHSPTCLEPRERGLETAQVVEHPHGGSDEDNQRPDEEHIEHRSRNSGFKNIEGHTDKPYHQCPDIDITALPEPVNQHSETVKTTPDHKVPAGSVPQPSEKHSVHSVDVRNQLLAVLLAESNQESKDGGNHKHHSENPPVLGESRGQERDSKDDGVRAESAVAVASKRNVEIVLKPLGQRNVPSLPELSSITGLVRRIEVLRQVEAHQHSDSRGYVSVAGEVGIDLKRIAEQSRKVLETGVKQRILEHPVTKVYSEIITENQFLGKSVKNPEDRHTKLPPTKEERLVKLWKELLGTHDRPGHKLREETQVKTEIPEIADRPDRPAGHINHIADGLEDEERDSHRQKDRIDAERLRAGQLIA